MSKHIPAPWGIWKNHLMIFAGPARENTSSTLAGFRANIAEVDDLDCSKSVALANARHIVRCVNTHDALILALQGYLANHSNAASGDDAGSVVCECDLCSATRKLLLAAEGRRR